MDKNTIFGQQKILNHLDRMSEWIKNGDKTIITAEIDMTNNCNNACPKCTGGRSNRDSLTYQEATKAIDGLIELGARGLIFTGGGEPLMNKETVNAATYAYKKGLDIGFITNGLLLNEQNAKALIEICTWIRISLDAGDAKTYWKTHGLSESGFELVKKNIARLVDIKDQFNLPCTVGVGYLTGKDTIKGMYRFTEVAKELGVDYAQFRPFHFDYTDITKELNQCKKLADKDFKVISSSHKYSHFKDINKRPYDKCYGCNFACVITANGDMTVCCHTRGKKEYTLGNIKEKSIKEIWNDREDVFKDIDLTKCGPMMCRADEFNRLLWELKKPKQHINFL